MLFVLALVLVHRALASDPRHAGTWLSDRSRRDAILRALSPVPFAGIAFLWFIGVVIVADRMLPLRKHGVMIPGPQSRAARLAFEK